MPSKKITREENEELSDFVDELRIAIFGLGPMPRKSDKRKLNRNENEKATLYENGNRHIKRHLPSP